jgi:hypothetical protein
MRTKGSISILFGLLFVLGAIDAAAYVVNDSISAGENITFGWTKDGQPYSPAWRLTFQCAGDTEPTEMNLAPGVPFDFNNLRPDLKGKACTFHFEAPTGATDWTQKIIRRDGTSSVFSGNIDKHSPWRFFSLSSLPAVPARIPDLAPVDAPGVTVYAAVNLKLYMSENPNGFLGGAWAPGQTLQELGIAIVNGQIPGVEGITWSTTPFTFNPDPAGPGFVPSGGAASLLNSQSFPYSLMIVEQHSTTPANLAVNVASVGHGEP